MSNLETQTSNTGGATNSVPQPQPIFKFRVGSKGVIKVYYLLKNTATIAFDNKEQNKIYGTRELQGTPELDAISLVFNASNHYHTTSLQEDPFIQLLQDQKAMKRLSKVLRKIWRGE